VPKSGGGDSGPGGVKRGVAEDRAEYKAAKISYGYRVIQEVGGARPPETPSVTG